MDNVTSLVDFLNNNSPIINAFATLVQAGATIGLLAVTCYLWKATSESGNYVKNQTKIMADQLIPIPDPPPKSPIIMGSKLSLE